MGETIAFRLPAAAAAGAESAVGAGAAAAGAACPGGGAGAWEGASQAPPVALAEMRTERPAEVSSSSPMPVRCTSRISRFSSRSSNPATDAPPLAVGPGPGPTLRAGAPRAGAPLVGSPRVGVPVARRGPPRFGRSTGRSAARAMRLQSCHEAAQGEQVTLRPEPGHRTHGDTRDQGRVTERFTSGRVRHVHLDRGEARARDRVAERDARVREAARVDDHTVTSFAGLVE